MNAAEPLWRANPLRRLHWRDWGSDSIAFDARSGRTHRVTALAAAALAWLEERPHSRESLVIALAGDMATVPDDVLRAAVATALDEFGERDWIEACLPPR